MLNEVLKLDCLMKSLCCNCFLHPKGPDVAQRISQYLSTTFEHRAIHLLADKFQILYDWYDNVDQLLSLFHLCKSTPDFLKLVVFEDEQISFRLHHRALADRLPETPRLSMARIFF